jgi:hypothetical protein
VKRLRVEVTKGKGRGSKATFGVIKLEYRLCLEFCWSSTDKSKGVRESCGLWLWVRVVAILI